MVRLNYLSLRVERKLIWAWSAKTLCSKKFSFALSAQSFVAFHDYRLRDKLDLFLLEVLIMNLTAQIFWASSTNLFRSCFQNFALKVILFSALSANTFLPNLRVKRKSPLRQKESFYKFLSEHIWKFLSTQKVKSLILVFWWSIIL